MQAWTKVLWVVITACSAVSAVWFLLGSTANFQRPLDLVNTVRLLFIWIPSVVLILSSIVLFVMGWRPVSGATYAGLFAGLVLLVFLAVNLVQSVNTEGWLTERVTSDSIKITTDGKYEYRVDFVNLFQSNSHARLYLKNTATGEELGIPIEIDTQEINGIAVGDVNHWVRLEPTGLPTRYILYTTEDLPIPVEKFEINVSDGSSRRVE